MPIPTNETDDILEGRRILIEETKRFKLLDDAGKLMELQNLLRTYHAEIDSLAIKCRSSHSVINKLKESNDHSKTECAALEQQNKTLKHDLEITKQELAKESKRLEELTDDLHLFSKNQTHFGTDENLEALKKEYKAALEKIDYLQVNQCVATNNNN